MQREAVAGELLSLGGGKTQLVAFKKREHYLLKDYLEAALFCNKL